MFDTHVPGQVRRLFEPACGTGRLVFRLAQAGYNVSGLDLNPRAVDYCNRRLARHGLPASVFVGDMADFRLPRKVDAAFNTINSFRHLLSESAARSHLQCVAESLRKGGVYVLGLHLTPTEGTPLDEERWSARRGHLAINTHLQTFDLDLRQPHRTLPDGNGHLHADRSAADRGRTGLPHVHGAAIAAAVVRGAGVGA